MLKTPTLPALFDTLFDTLRISEDLYSTPATRSKVYTKSSDYSRVEEKNNELYLSIDLPGVKSNEISVQITARDIDISGKLRGEDFKYAYSLSKEYDPDAVTAIYEDGVLTLTFRKFLVFKTKTIEIKVK